jgi:hypothetical protein
MNYRTRGNKVQRKLILSLKEQGFIVSKVEQTGMYTKETDMFGLFDLCCIREDKLLMVQVTGGKSPHTHKHYKEFSLKYDLPSVEYQQWWWIPRVGWKVWVYESGKHKVIRDDRKK